MPLPSLPEALPRNFSAALSTPSIRSADLLSFSARERASLIILSTSWLELPSVGREAVGVVDGAVDLRDIERARDAGDVAQDRVDVLTVLGERQREALDIGERAVHHAGVDGAHELGDVVESGVGLRSRGVEPGRQRRRVLEDLVDVLAVVLERRGEALDVVEAAVDAGRIDGAHERADVGERRIELVGALVEAAGEPRRVAQRVRDVLPVLRERLGEALDVLDVRATRCGSTARTSFVDVVGERLELCGERPDALRRLADLLEEAVDAGRVFARAPARSARRW